MIIYNKKNFIVQTYYWNKLIETFHISLKDYRSAVFNVNTNLFSALKKNFLVVTDISNMPKNSKLKVQLGNIVVIDSSRKKTILLHEPITGTYSTIINF